MSKTFAPRTSKKERKVIEIAPEIKRDVFRISDERLLRGARLQDVKLSEITVKEQVRTKFNDDSLKELAENIRVNGLIQPLVLHREGSQYVLICGERRFRAMSLIKMTEAPCFILENKSPEELMAIQFSENSSRENLHYIDKADGIYNYHTATGASERKIQAALGISKSEVHRSIIIAKMSRSLKEAAKRFDIEKYVLLEFMELPEGDVKATIEDQILKGEIVKRTEFKKAVGKGGLLKAGQKVTKQTRKKAQPDLRALEKSVPSIDDLKGKKGKKLDAKTLKLLQALVEEAKELMQN